MVADPDETAAGDVPAEESLVCALEDDAGFSESEDGREGEAFPRPRRAGTSLVAESERPLRVEDSGGIVALGGRFLGPPIGTPPR